MMRFLHWRAPIWRGVGALMTRTVQRLGCTASTAAERASARLAIAIGATSLRKAGVLAAQINNLLAQADMMFPHLIEG